MKISIKTAVYKEYFIDTDTREITNYDGIDELAEWNVKNKWNLSSTSKEIIIDKSVIPDNQEDYNYLAKNGQNYLFDLYKRQEELDELNGIYEKSLGIEEDERISF